MSTDLGPEFFEKYNAILNKLKKRFMRKPNVSEAIEEFNGLALQSALAEQPAHAALCQLGAAKCAELGGSAPREAESLLLAARHFLRAELKLASLKCISPARENLEAAISCYCHASSKYPEGSSLRGCIALELADGLERLGHLGEAAQYYQTAIDNYANSPGNIATCLDKIASIYMKLDKHDEALNIFNKLDDLAHKHNYKSYIQKCEVNRLFLYLIVQPSSKEISPSLEKLIDRFSTDIDDDELIPDDTILHPDLFLNLQSVLLACIANDVQTLISLQSELKIFLSIEQQDLMRAVIALYDSMM